MLGSLLSTSLLCAANFSNYREFRATSLPDFRGLRLMHVLPPRRIFGSGTVLIEKSVLLPQPLQLSEDSMGIGWVEVEEELRSRMEQTLAAAGWTFFFMAHAIQASAFGFDRQKAMKAALNRLIVVVRRKRCNSLEIDTLSIRSFWGLVRVSLSAHPRHIQMNGIVFRPAA